MATRCGQAIERAALTTGSITLSGGLGPDNTVDETGTTATTTSSLSALSATPIYLYGGRGNDRIKARSRRDVIHAGRGYDRCVVPTLHRAWLSIHVDGCEVVRKVA